MSNNLLIPFESFSERGIQKENKATFDKSFFKEITNQLN